MSSVGSFSGRWQQSRRRFMRNALASAGAVSIVAMNKLGAAPPAEADDPVCLDPSGFQYRGGICFPADYTTNCSKGGCYRSGIQSSAANCPSNGLVYKERHRTCGENRIVNGVPKRFALRLNDCSGNYDGWEWVGTDTDIRCGCTSPRRILWSCNDGWISGYDGSTWGEYIPSICMTDVCWNG